MLSIEDLSFVIQISASNSLAEVSRKLNVTPSAVTQRLKQVEDRAGVCLVDRSTRQLCMTSEGELVVTRGRTILYDLDDLTVDLDMRRDIVTGKLRIAAPLRFGRLHVAPVISRFCKNFPDIKIELELSERPNMLIHDNYDLTIHIGELLDSGLIVHKLAPNKRLLCAAPRYLAENGYPQTTNDLRRHKCIVIRENDEDVTMWRLTRSAETSHIRIDPKYSCNDGEVVRNWALDGLGIMVRSEWDIASELKSGRLIQLLPGFTFPDADVVALLSHRAGRAARTSAFLEELYQEFTPVPWRIRKSSLVE
jgi:DNA-binding transcriptional LysR family regulator